MGALKDFIIAERPPTNEMSLEDLQAECGGWRAFVNMVPNEVMEWVVRMGEPYRLMTRKYEPKTGTVTNVKFEAVEWQLELVEPAFDSLRGNTLIEVKVLTIPKEAVLYGEEIIDSQPREDWEVEQNLALQSLE